MTDDKMWPMTGGTSDDQAFLAPSCVFCHSTVSVTNRLENIFLKSIETFDCSEGGERWGWVSVNNRLEDTFTQADQTRSFGGLFYWRNLLEPKDSKVLKADL